MPKDLTIFGIVKRNTTDACFCYAFIRDVRGRGAYPDPLLPKEFVPDAPMLHAIGDNSALELAIWNGLLPEPQADALLKSLDEGKFTVPPECPIQPAKEFSGRCCEPIIVEERNNHWVRTAGTGLLRCRSLVISEAIDSLSSQLAKWIGPGDAPDALAEVVSLIAQHSGLKNVFLTGPRLGLTDHFYRTEFDLHSFGPLVRIIPEKPDFQRRDPMTTCHVQREFARPDRAFDLHYVVSNFDEKLDACLVEFPAGQDQVEIKIRSHITDIELHAFNLDGSLAQTLNGAFTQAFNFGITARGASDLLPPVFKGADYSNNDDLMTRPRISTLASKGPAVGPRSGEFDMLRTNRDKIEALIGKQNAPAPECRWFERGDAEQIAVIRWIKSKLEEPGVRKAFLVDPFLGNDALQRVIIRQGNENIQLTILISPGDIDPDAGATDAKATSSHRDKLAATATAFSEQLCGHLLIVDIQRGDGARQAFHDRYFGTVNQHGLPTYYLLSNSLSKAAGDWPFAIIQLDQTTSHRVHHYVQQLSAGKDRDRKLTPVEVFKRQPAQTTGFIQTTPERNENNDAPWKNVAAAFIRRLIDTSTRKANDGSEMEDEIDTFVSEYPTGVNPDELAASIYRDLSYHEENIVRIAIRFSFGSHPEISAKLNELLVNGFIGNLPKDIERCNCHWLFGNQRREVFAYLARIISGRSKATDFVRTELNPIVEAIIRAIETQRDDRSFELVHIATCLVAIGLEVALLADTADSRFRAGLASDYIHWAGRLMRSVDTHIRYDGGNRIPDFWRDDVAYLAGRIAGARAAIGEKLAEAVDRILKDDFVLEQFKAMINKQNQ